MGRLAARGRAWLAAATAGLLAAACASAPDRGAGGGESVVHVVRPGENVYRISRYYGVPQQDIVRANGIDDVTAIPIGTRLLVPRARKDSAPRSLAVAYVPTSPSSDLRGLARRESDLEFQWPVRGRVSSRFGWRRGRRHEGVDIPAKRGTAIRAAEAGKVIHSGGGLGAYGKVVIIKHAGHYSSVYAHNRTLKVRKGQFVEKGDVIAEVGRTGNASGPHLHFEIRRDQRPQDPLLYLR